MNILLLEDRGSVSVHLKTLLERHGHRVFPAFNCNDAESFFPACDCYIIDLNLSTDGLTVDEVKQSMGGKLAGWVWFKRRCAQDHKLTSRVIIFSEYLASLREVEPGIEAMDIRQVSKSASNSPIEALLGHIKGIQSLTISKSK